MSSNYPPGVTGREYEIAGADYEVEREVECSTCGIIAIRVVQGYRGVEWFHCSHCGEQTDIDLDIDEEPSLEDL